jgi:cobalt-zinc-cadmium efflux system outer membrane protein
VLVLAAGCKSAHPDVYRAIEGHIEAAAAGAPEVVPCAAVAPAPVLRGPVSLAALWGLALAKNPALREAAADVEAAQGRYIQAGLYPNPRVIYNEDTIGSSIAPLGNFTIQVNQEIITAGKRRLDMAVAEREKAAALVALLGRKFEVLTRVRRAWYDYLALRYLLERNGETVAILERGLEVTRRQVETARSRPETDLLRLEALLNEARINQARARDVLEGAWRQLAAEVGVPELPPPEEVCPLPEDAPLWDDNAVLRRVLSSNTALKQAAIEVERAQLALKRARAGAIPNFTVGAGYDADNTDQTAGAVINFEAAIPVWNRQQGAIREAEARLASAQAALRSAETRLARETAEALARYKAAGRQVNRLGRDVLPRLQRSLDLLLKAYQAGSTQITFIDGLTTEQNLAATRLTQAEGGRSLWQAVAGQRLGGLTAGGPARPRRAAPAGSRPSLRRPTTLPDHTDAAHLATSSRGGACPLIVRRLPAGVLCLAGHPCHLSILSLDRSPRRRYPPPAVRLTGGALCGDVPATPVPRGKTRETASIREASPGRRCRRRAGAGRLPDPPDVVALARARPVGRGG